MVKIVIGDFQGAQVLAGNFIVYAAQHTSRQMARGVACLTNPHQARRMQTQVPQCAEIFFCSVKKKAVVKGNDGDTVLSC